MPDFFFYVICAFIIAFPLSIVRLGLMALFVNDAPRFDFWHGTGGGTIFMSLSFFIFAAIILIRSPGDRQPTPLIVRSASAYQPKSSTFFVLTTLIISLLLGYVILFPQSEIRKIASYQFPSNIELTGWRLDNSHELSLAEIGATLAKENEINSESILSREKLLEYQAEQKYSNLILAARRFFFVKDDENSLLNLTLRYVINADGNLPGLNNPDFSEFNPEALQKELDNNPSRQDYGVHPS